MPTRLEQELRKRGWSKSELARRSATNQTAVIDIVNGRMVPGANSVVMQRIACALNWDGAPSWLLEEAKGATVRRRSAESAAEKTTESCEGGGHPTPRR